MVHQFLLLLLPLPLLVVWYVASVKFLLLIVIMSLLLVVLMQLVLLQDVKLLLPSKECLDDSKWHSL